MMGFLENLEYILGESFRFSIKVQLSCLINFTYALPEIS